MFILKRFNLFFILIFFPISFNAFSSDNLVKDCKPIFRTQPSYPKRAQELVIQGFVKFKFDVNSSGLVDNVVILDSQPKGIFENSVYDAVKLWRYNCPLSASGIILTAQFRFNGLSH